MEDQNSQLFLKDADGNRVPVSRNVYDTYWRYANKEDYFMRSLKEERFRYDPEHQIAEFLPSREDSYERLLEEGEEFACEQKSVEDQVIDDEIIQTLICGLSEDDLRLIRLLMRSGKTDLELSEELHIPKSTLHSRKKAILFKCQQILSLYEAEQINDTS